MSKLRLPLIVLCCLALGACATTPRPPATPASPPADLLVAPVDLQTLPPTTDLAVTPAPVSDAVALSTVAQNYETCRDAIAQVRGWQRWWAEVQPPAE